jgi:hypothetical protein
MLFYGGITLFFFASEAWIQHIYTPEKIYERILMSSFEDGYGNACMKGASRCLGSWDENGFLGGLVRWKIPYSIVDIRNHFGPEGNNERDQTNNCI